VLEPVPPFRLDLTVWALRRRPDNTVDRWDGSEYRRVLAPGAEPVEVKATQFGPTETPQLQVTVAAPRRRPGLQEAATSALEKLLGLRIDLAGFYRLAAGDARLGPLAGRFRGLKPPRFPSVFEGLVNGIACQQVTLTLGIRLLNRLAETCGLAAAGGASPAHAFPRAQDLAGLTRETLRRLGFSGQKAHALLDLAGAVQAGLDLEGLAALDDDTAVERLRQLGGVGRWTAEYVLLRGLGRLHVFPGDDVGARNNLQRWLRLRKSPDYAAIRRHLKRWQPYGGVIYFHLLLDGLDAAGQLAEVAVP
jgi:DNA-3-methyladenine glycosylase II